MAAIAITGGNYEIRVKEFAQPMTQTEAMGLPTDVTNWQDNNPSGTEVPDGTIDRIFPPIWLGVVGSMNPIWVVAYSVLLSHGV